MPEIADTSLVSTGELVSRRNALMRELLTVGAAVRESRPEPTQFPVGDGSSITKHETVSLDSANDKSPVWTVNGIHVELFDYISINRNAVTPSQERYMQYLNKWIMDNGSTFREGLRKLNDIDIRLGSCDLGETKLAKLYHYLRLRNGNSET